MIEIRKTEIFAKWLDGLRDIRGRARVQARIERLIGWWRKKHPSQIHQNRLASRK